MKGTNSSEQDLGNVTSVYLSCFTRASRCHPCLQTGRTKLLTVPKFLSIALVFLSSVLFYFSSYKAITFVSFRTIALLFFPKIPQVGQFSGDMVPSSHVLTAIQGGSHGDGEVGRR